MAWIESHSILIEHPKVREAAKILNIKPVIMVGHLTCFWHKVIELREDGDVSQWTDEDISYYSKWEGDPKLFYETLKNHFIDEKNGLKLVHDWLDYAWKYLYSKYHTNNPKLLKAIQKKYRGKVKHQGRPKLYPKVSLPNQPNQPNLTNHKKNIVDGIDQLISNYTQITGKEIKKPEIYKVMLRARILETMKKNPAYTFAELLEIPGLYMQSAWHTGDNPAKKEYLGIRLMYRSDDRVLTVLDWKNKPKDKWEGFVNDKS